MTIIIFREKGKVEKKDIFLPAHSQVESIDLTGIPVVRKVCRDARNKAREFLKKSKDFNGAVFFSDSHRSSIDKGILYGRSCDQTKVITTMVSRMTETETVREAFRERFSENFSLVLQGRNIEKKESDKFGEKGWYFKFYPEWDMRKVFLGKSSDVAIAFIENAMAEVFESAV